MLRYRYYLLFPEVVQESDLVLAQRFILGPCGTLTRPFSQELNRSIPVSPFVGIGVRAVIKSIFLFIESPIDPKRPEKKLGFDPASGLV